MVTKLGTSNLVKEVKAHWTQISSLARSGRVRSHYSAQGWHSKRCIRHPHLFKFAQSTLNKRFIKAGLADIGIDEVRTQHLRIQLKVSAINSSCQETLERSKQIQTCCKGGETKRLKKCQFGDCQHMACSSHRDWIA
eukprot:5683508-Amphidinium_carterae.2